MSQPYWSWGSDVPECDAPSVGPQVCKDLDELNSIVQQLRNKVAVLDREKGKLEERVLCLEKCTSHADARKIGDAGAERNKTKDAGEERNKTEDGGEESQKTEDGGEESDKTENGGVAESREQCVQNGKEEVQYTPPDINWDDPGVVCVTLVKFLTNPPQKIDMSTAEGECGEDVIVGVWQKRGRGKSEILGPAMKRRRAVVRETPWICREIPNISEDTIADSLRPDPRDTLLEVAKFCWEWGQEENSHVRLCGEDGMEGSHNFFVLLLTKDGWLDDSNIDMALLLLRERHKRSGNWVGSDWTILDTTFQVSVMMHISCATMQKCAALDYKQMKAYVGKEDRQHNKGLLGMVKGEGPKLAKSWSSVNRNSSHPTGRAAGGENAAPVVKGIWIYWRRSTSENKWPVIRVMDAPQQVGGGDCGMYILKYCEFLTSNVDLAKISHDAMPFYRLKLAVQLLQGY
ncbi:unnamed protein product [Prunus armeniaca]|nr:unnamed protein product [Prunus armeniaca]CAB4299867.1 unnamed protein product [Prunus armeniaca]